MRSEGENRARFRRQLEYGLAAAIMLCFGFCGTAVAEDTNASGALEEILVTAQKRGAAEAAQDVPIAITAFNARSLEELHVRDLQSLSVSIPNVALDSVGTIPGFANFEIRGFGINSSIPSVEPAVGVFVDGVYQGQTSGIVLDTFDLDSIEVLRGPQGTLFGRNTTGGAVVLRTRRPEDEFQIRGQASIETGLLKSGGISVEGSIAPQLRGKLAAYISDDEGFFRNNFDNAEFGKRRTSFVRPVLTWSLSNSVDSTIILEKGTSVGDGASASNPKIDRGFDLDINYPGYVSINWAAVTSETNAHVAFGSGVVTNVAGWRKLSQDAGEDVDGQPITGFHARHFLDQRQFSEELRYAGTFGQIDVTTGLFFFRQHFLYVEQRTLATVKSGPVAFGGDIHETSWAAFTQEQYHLTSALSVIAGLRYSWERKQAQVATLVIPNSLCSFDARSCKFNFPGAQFAEPGEKSWANVTPRIGLEWKALSDVLLYATWSQGVRSGGYNVRSTAQTIGPGPYDEERQNSFEVGMKSEWMEHRLRANFAAFHNGISGLQRDINDVDPVSGVVQITRNAGNATINGGEVELSAAVSRSWTLGANAGYLHGKYDRLFYDLNGAKPGLGYELALARLAPWTYGGFIANSTPAFRSGSFKSRLEFGHRDRAAYTDNNVGILNPVDNLLASLAYVPANDKFEISIYGRNLLNRVTDGGYAPLPAAVGGGFFVPINKGRVIGAQVNFNF